MVKREIRIQILDKHRPIYPQTIYVNSLTRLFISTLLLFFFYEQNRNVLFDGLQKFIN